MKKEVDLMHEAVIVDVVRTPAGKRNGKLKDCTLPTLALTS